METLSFYTTALIYNLLNEGAFKTFFAIMDDSGIDDVYVSLFLKGCVKLERDTGSGGLTLTTLEKPYEIDLQTAILTWLKSSEAYKEYGKVNFDPIYAHDWKKEHERLKHHLGERYIPHAFNSRQSELFELIGYSVVDKNSDDKLTISGIVIEDGTFIQCPYMGHALLEEQLKEMGYDEDLFLNVSSDTLYGSLLSILCIVNDEKPEHCHDNIVKQFKKLKALGVTNSKYYKNPFYELQLYFLDHYNNGGKYAGLKMLDEIYGLKIPKISSTYFDGASFIRSSPKHSIPGLLESYPISNQHDAKQVIKKMEEDYSETKNFKNFNQFHYFFQEFVEGKTGVAHYSDKGFSYALSDKNYDIVNGVDGEEKLSAENEARLESVLKEIYLDYSKDYLIQIEFCINNENDIVYLQFRSFKEEKNIQVPTIVGQTICEGKSFCKGVIEQLYGSDILVVDSDCEIRKLFTHKALIVTGDLEFSHVLAMSRQLNIPSIFATGQIEIDDSATYAFISADKGEVKNI